MIATDEDDGEEGGSTAKMAAMPNSEGAAGNAENELSWTGFDSPAGSG